MSFFKLNQKLLIVTIPIIITISLFFAYDYFRHDKIAIVRTGELLDKSKRLKVINEQLQQEYKIAAGNADTLRRRCETQTSLKKDSPEARLACEEYQRYNESVSQQMEQHKQQTIAKELEAINKQIEVYGKAHGYRVIFGTTKDGNVLFARNTDDITSELIDYINQ
jgi:outer membrane protein